MPSTISTQAVHTHAVLIADFSPLTLIHLDDIHHAGGHADTLHLIVRTPAIRPLPSGRTPTLADAVRWVQVACQDYPFVKVHTWASLGVDDSALGVADFDYQTCHQASTAEHTIGQLHAILADKLASDHLLIFIKQGADLSHRALRTLAPHPYDDLAIHEKPLTHFHKLHPACRAFYTQTVCIVGGESSGKTTLLHKLANHYGASFALEIGRLYTHTHLGGSELALQYSDYTPIATRHAMAISDACAQACAPVTLIDTDFITSQAFCEVYEKRTHPVLTALADEMRMDFTIYLDNNVAWVADGMRRLGGDARTAFASHLLALFEQHQIPVHIIDDADYHKRYLQAVALIDGWLTSC